MTENKKEKEKKIQGKSPEKGSGEELRPKRRFKKNVRKPTRRQRVKPEFDHKVIDIRRVTRVVAGGRRFSFSVALIAGNRKGRVGVGVGKASDTALAIEKATRDAKKNMVDLNLTKDMSVPHEVKAKYNSAVVKIFPAPGKGGITAGSAVRNVLELAGAKGVGGKILSRSKNKLNNARATMKALRELEPIVSSKEK